MVRRRGIYPLEQHENTARALRHLSTRVMRMTANAETALTKTHPVVAKYRIIDRYLDDIRRLYTQLLLDEHPPGEDAKREAELRAMYAKPSFVPKVPEPQTQPEEFPPSWDALLKALGKQNPLYMRKLAEQKCLHYDPAGIVLQVSEGIHGAQLEQPEAKEHLIALLTERFGFAGKLAVVRF